jgi:NAD(P)-dependent dehydrogenase (short-subunit alcohol dehydrogenase family)
VLITGGASGLGAATVQAVTDAGGHAVVLDINEPAISVEFLRVDLADSASTGDAVRRVVGDGLDAVVTAAGIDACGALEDVADDAWERVVKVNLLGTAAVVRAALPTLAQRRGRVVTIASTLGLRGVADATAYCASKFGVVGFTRALAAETAGSVGVTLVIPGGMHTAFFDNRDDRYRPPADARLNRPGDVADVVLVELRQPVGCELREVVVCPSTESSWP